MWDNVGIRIRMIKRINVLAKDIQAYQDDDTYHGDTPHPILTAIGKCLKRGCSIDSFSFPKVDIETNTGEYLEVLLPTDIRPFIQKINCSRGVPFSFDLFIPNEILKSTRKSKINWNPNDTINW